MKILNFLLLILSLGVFTVKADNIKVACVGNSITEGFAAHERRSALYEGTAF